MGHPSEQASRVEGRVAESEHAVRFTFTPRLTRRERMAVGKIVDVHRRIRSISWESTPGGEVLVCAIKQRNGKNQPVERLEGIKRALLHNVREQLNGLQARRRGSGQPPLPVRHSAYRRLKLA